MIGGDSTASHMGSVKNIEKARERRTLDTMPGSTSTGVPDDLLAHSESIHPRMGYDMSDSIFMQEMQAAGRSKESKRALEERSALEAFRAAALQKPLDISAASLSRGRSRDAGGAGEGTGSSGVGSGGGGGGNQKLKADAPQPLAGIRLKKKSRGEAASKEGYRGEHGAHSDGGQSKKKKKSSKGKSKSKHARTGAGGDGRDAGGAVRTRGGGEAKDKDGGDKGEEAGAGLGLGLVAYSSGSDGELDTR